MFFFFESERKWLPNQPIEELNLPLVCVISVLVTPLCCWMSKNDFFNSLWERGFSIPELLDFVSKICACWFLYVYFFHCKTRNYLFCVLIYSHLEFSVLSCAVLPSLSQCVSSTIKFMCWVCNTFCYFFSYVNFVRLFIARNKRIYSLESCIFWRN